MSRRSPIAGARGGEVVREDRPGQRSGLPKRGLPSSLRSPVVPRTEVLLHELDVNEGESFVAHTAPSARIARASRPGTAFEGSESTNQPQIPGDAVDGMGTSPLC